MASVPASGAAANGGTGQAAIEAAALRSDRFRLEREGEWKRLEAIVARIEIVTFHQSLRLATRTPLTTEEAQYSTAFPAAVAAVRTLPFPFILTARAENYLHGNPDLNDTIRRLQAFAEAGADVLYAPGLRNAEEVLAVVRAVAPKPVNVLMSGGLKLTVQELQEMGVRRNYYPLAAFKREDAVVMNLPLGTTTSPPP